MKGLRNTDLSFVSIPAEGVLCEKAVVYEDGATEWKETFLYPDGRRIKAIHTGAYYCAGNNGEWRQAHSYAIDITFDNGWQNQPIVPDFVPPTEFYYVDRLPASRSAS